MGGVRGSEWESGRYHPSSVSNRACAHQSVKCGLQALPSPSLHPRHGGTAGGTYIRRASELATELVASYLVI
jgi:hypothetical protein